MVGALIVLAACSSDGDSAVKQSDAARPTGDSVVVEAQVTTEPSEAEADVIIPDDDAEAGVPPVEGVVGDATEVVEAAVQETLDPVTLDEPVATDDGVMISIAEIDRIDAEAQLPGEIAGPALLVVVRIINSGPDPIDLFGVTVNVFDADGQASTPLTADPASPIFGVLAAGDSIEGRYVFSFDTDRPQPVTVEASHSVDRPIARFVGDIS
jgi:hypothetical protein